MTPRNDRCRPLKPQSRILTGDAYSREARVSKSLIANFRRDSDAHNDREQRVRGRCVYIGDREADIYELFCTAREAATNFLVRTRKFSHYLTKIARLGGYLARASYPPPGNVVMWRGLSRMTDIELGVAIGAKFVGN
jgi:hypothetical protein